MAASDTSDPPDRVRGLFLSDLAHDLSTPLTAIHGATELLLTGMTGHLDAGQRELLQEVLASASDLRGLVQDLADLGAMDAGRLILAPTTFDLAAMVSRLAGELREVAQRRSVTFSLDAAIDPPQVIADERRCGQVMAGLFGYAVRGAKRGSQVAGRVMRHGRVVLVDVRSNGVVSPADPLSLFAERRDRAPGVPKPYRGPGLGLPFVARVVTALGGGVTAAADGDGLVLGLTFPTGPGPDDVAKSTSA